MVRYADCQPENTGWAAVPASGAAQATGGCTTAFTLATEAAVRAVTTRVEALLLAAQTADLSVGDTFPAPPR